MGRRRDERTVLRRKGRRTTATEGSAETPGWRTSDTTINLGLTSDNLLISQDVKILSLTEYSSTPRTDQQNLWACREHNSRWSWQCRPGGKD